MSDVELFPSFLDEHGPVEETALVRLRTARHPETPIRAIVLQSTKPHDGPVYRLFMGQNDA